MSIELCDVCGHARLDHARGQFRTRWVCEYPDCDCEDYRGPVSIATGHNPELEELARRAVESQKLRKHEDIEAWAARLAADLSKFTD